MIIVVAVVLGLYTWKLLLERLNDFVEFYAVIRNKLENRIMAYGMCEATTARLRVQSRSFLCVRMLTFAWLVPSLTCLPRFSSPVVMCWCPRRSGDHDSDKKVISPAVSAGQQDVPKTLSETHIGSHKKSCYWYWCCYPVKFLEQNNRMCRNE